MKASQIKRLLSLAAPAFSVVVLTACGPSEKQLAERAEAARIDCLDKICPGNGEVTPKFDYTKDALLKLNGEWYVGPKEYFSSGHNGAVFYWPSKQPGFKGGAYPEEKQKFYEKSIEIFLTGRHRWPTPNVEKPWEGATWAKRISRMESEGYQTERTKLNPSLELVRFRFPDGKTYSTNFYVATEERRVRGGEPPVLACDVSTPPHPQDSCTAGEYWQADVYADFRFRAKHASDWPEIHQEIIRVLNLANKVQP